jgi:hypothetical protein
MLGLLPIYAISGASHYVNSGAFASGTSTCAPAYPTTRIAADNTLLLVLATRDMSALTGLGSWTLLGSREIGASGYEISIYTKNTVAGTETGTLSLGGTPGATPFMGGVILNYQGVTAEDNSTGGGYDIAGGTDVAFNSDTPDAGANWSPGDIALWAVLFDTHNYTYSDVYVTDDSEDSIGLRDSPSRGFYSATDGDGFAIYIYEGVCTDSAVGSGVWRFHATASGSTSTSPYAAGQIIRLST